MFEIFLNTKNYLASLIDYERLSFEEDTTAAELSKYMNAEIRIYWIPLSLQEAKDNQFLKTFKRFLKL